MLTKFTQAIKDNWLENLRSGAFKQGFYTLYDKKDNSYCCIGVLRECTKGLDGDSEPYIFLENTIGEEPTERLYRTNDDPDYQDTGKRDYSNVIPLIESLPVQE